jgi:CelD/BcsL family acetyltransferase involved in cellulose biosynthesis
MKVRVIRGADLTDDLAARWSLWQRQDASLASPYFRPEFTRAAACFFRGTKVGVMEEAGEVVGFLPFQQGWGGAGRPAGGDLSDYQGAIVRPGLKWDVREVVRKCGISSLEYDYAVASQIAFAPYHTQLMPSHIVDLRGGHDQYRAQHRNRRLKELSRKLQREVGEIRFELRSSNGAAMQRLFEIKRQQYARTGRPDVLEPRHVRQFLEHLLQLRSDEFEGMLSVLYAGERMVAAHLGMRSKEVWHWWFPAYELAWASYCPGLLLLQHMIDAAPEVGAGMIDLGYGDEPYKVRAANHQVMVARTVVGRSWPASCRRWVRQAKASVVGTALETPARLLYRGVALCLGRRPAQPSEEAV